MLSRAPAQQFAWEPKQPYLNGDEDDYHPLQPQAVFLTQVTPHEVCKLRAVLQLLIHHLMRTTNYLVVFLGCFLCKNGSLAVAWLTFTLRFMLRNWQVLS